MKEEETKEKLDLGENMTIPNEIKILSLFVLLVIVSQTFYSGTELLWKNILGVQQLNVSHYYVLGILLLIIFIIIQRLVFKLPLHSFY